MTPLPDATIPDRFIRVIDHIDSHLESVPGVEVLAGIAAYSPYHFLRQFAALFDIPVAQYVRLMRLRRAAHALAFRTDQQIIEIAFQAGYETPEAFARAFRKIHDQSPTDFRAAPDWENWQAPYDKLRTVRARSNRMTTPSIGNIAVIDFPRTRTICLDHHGPQAHLGHTIRRFIDWRRAHRLPPSKAATFNIIWCHPDDTPPADFRFGLGVATPNRLTADDANMGLYELMLPAMRCAKLRHIGSDQMIGDSALRLYRDWLPQSGETPGDFPLFFQRVSFYPDVPDHEAITDIFLPLAS